MLSIPRARIAGAETSDLVALHQAVSTEIARRLAAECSDADEALPDCVERLRITRSATGTVVACVDASGGTTCAADVLALDAHRGIGMQRVHVLVGDARAESDVRARLAARETVALVIQRLVLADDGAMFDLFIDADSAEHAVDEVAAALDGHDGVRVLAGPAPTHQPAIRTAFRHAGFATRTPKPPRRER